MALNTPVDRDCVPKRDASTLLSIVLFMQNIRPFISLDNFLLGGSVEVLSTAPPRPITQVILAYSFYDITHLLADQFVPGVIVCFGLILLKNQGKTPDFARIWPPKHPLTSTPPSPTETLGSSKYHRRITVPSCRPIFDPLDQIASDSAEKNRRQSLSIAFRDPGVIRASSRC